MRHLESRAHLAPRPTSPGTGGRLGRLSGLIFSVACAAEPAAVDPTEHLPGGDTTNDLLFGSNAFSAPATNIGFEDRGSFFTGNAFFNQNWVAGVASTDGRDGLGPLFNARSCSGCHFRDGRGRPPLEPDEDFEGLLLRLSVGSALGAEAPAPDPRYGGQLQPYSVPGVPAEGRPLVSYTAQPGAYGDGTPYELLVPRYSAEGMAFGPLGEAVLLSPRVAPAMIGLGLLEAIEDAALVEAEDPDDRDSDGISGRANRVPDVATGSTRLGRFGWKAEQPSVRQQSAGAFLGDMGITSSLFPNAECTEVEIDCAREGDAGEQPELTDNLLTAVERYGQLLAVPSRSNPSDHTTLEGKALFESFGCDGCHTPSQRTGLAHAIEALRDQVIWPYTDLLLHDLGPELTDHRPSYDASGSEWRTPPLWGLGRYREVNNHDRLMHDGRARGVAEAILWHGGEAEVARERFRLAETSERAALVQFVESL